MEKELALAIEREKELNSICKDQAAQIEHLNKMVLDFFFRMTVKSMDLLCEYTS